MKKTVTMTFTLSGNTLTVQTTNHGSDKEDIVQWIEKWAKALKDGSAKIDAGNSFSETSLEIDFSPSQESSQTNKTPVSVKSAKVLDIRVDNFYPMPDDHRAQFNEWVLSGGANVVYQGKGMWTERGFKPGGDHDISTDGLYRCWVDLMHLLL